MQFIDLKVFDNINISKINVNFEHQFTTPFPKLLRSCPAGHEWASLVGFGTEFVLCIVSLITVLPDAWCGIIPGYFRSRTICNGEIQGSSDCGDYRVNILRLKETIVERLSRALADTCGIIHTYIVDRNVVLHFSDDCVSQFFTSTFDMEQHNVTHVGESMNRDYHSLLKVVSILHLVGESENESDMTDRFSRLENRIYSALCSINKVLRSLGWCEETRRRLYIERTYDMCEISNISERYIRNAQIFRSLRVLLISVALKYAQ